MNPKSHSGVGKVNKAIKDRPQKAGAGLASLAL